MNIDKLSSAMSRVFFIASLLFLVLAVIEKAANLGKYTLLRNYTPDKMLDVAAIMMVFVIALLLRQIREEMKARSAGGG